VIRPPDPSIKDRTLMYGPYSSAEATRRYIHLAFRDAHTAIDLTAAHGGFWKPPVPPRLAVTTNNLDPSSRADLHLDFADTGLPDDSYDLAVYDPPHLADLGADSIMGKRFGSAMGSDGLDQMVTAGVREAWRIARVGILVKLADSSHGSEFLQLSRWVAEQFDAQPYFVAHTTRPPLEDGKWKVQRVPRSNGAVYLVWRKEGHQHRDFDALYERQEERKASQFERERAREMRLRKPPKHCANCDAFIPSERHRQTATCSDSCRRRLSRQRAKGAPLRTYSTSKGAGQCHERSA
jgi:predicted nucleic acid-binding Zn ribbon protein